MGSTFYRLHPSDAPEFNADNAWSALWGRERSEDGTTTRCEACDEGTALDPVDCRACKDKPYIDSDCTTCGGDGFYTADCTLCDGTGWEPCVRGYSACHDAEDLIAYFTGRHMDMTGDTVIIFEGRQVDNGADGEPTVIPERVIETLTWEHLVARHQEQTA